MLIFSNREKVFPYLELSYRAKSFKGFCKREERNYFSIIVAKLLGNYNFCSIQTFACCADTGRTKILLLLSSRNIVGVAKTW